MKFKAYIDGSHHTKSKTSGWGFAIFENEVLLHECYGSVPEIWEMDFEYYAFAKLVQFCLENALDDILIHTDLLGMEKSYEKLSSIEIVQEAQKYIPILPKGNLNLKVKYISRKENTVADRLSRLHLLNLYNEERKEFLNCHGAPGSNKINFLHLPELLHSSRTMLKSTESRVLHAVKKHHLAFELFHNTNILRILWYRDKKSQEVLETLTLEKNVRVELFSKILQYSEKHKKILLLVEDKDFFDEIAGLKEKTFNAEESKIFSDILNNVQEIFLHYTPLYPIKKKNKKRDATFKTKGVYSSEVKKLILEKAISQEKFFKIVMSWDIADFTKKYQRKPSYEERSVLAQKRKEFLEKKAKLNQNKSAKECLGWPLS